MATSKIKMKKVEDRINYQSDVETDSISEVDSDVHLKPEKISIEIKTVSMDGLLRRLKQGTILRPAYQRREFWDGVMKSRLIESLMLKIPIPMFYVTSDPKGVWSILDGSQRLSAIRDFILKKTLVLQGLEYFKDFKGKTFNELPDYIKNILLSTEFTFTIINPGTPMDVVFNIFQRINTDKKQKK